MRFNIISQFQPTLPMRGATTTMADISADNVFQPTLPMRGATLTTKCGLKSSRNFNPRSPCGERLAVNRVRVIEGYFNPRSPCGERLISFPWAISVLVFQPTLPMRGATLVKHDIFRRSEISTHAPHAGSDDYQGRTLCSGRISTHAPHAGSDCQRCLLRIST